jgi:hypothetical protein
MTYSSIFQLISDKESLAKKQFNIQVKILGQVLHSANFDTTKASTTFNQLFVFDILSKTDTLKQFLSEHPPVEVSLLQSDKVVSHAKQFLESIELGVPEIATVFLYGSDMSCDLQPRVTLTLVISQLDGGGEKELKAQVVQKEATVVTPSAPPLLDEDTEGEIMSEFSKFEADKETLGYTEDFEEPEVVPRLELPPRFRALSNSKDLKR